MKPVFKCDYCSFMGTEKEVKEHELKCQENYDRRSCFTCEHKEMKNAQYICKVGKTIPENSILEFCSRYERNQKSNGAFKDLANTIFGGF